MIDGDKEIPPHPGDLEPLFIHGHGAGEKTACFAARHRGQLSGQGLSSASRGFVDAKKTPDDLEAQNLDSRGKGQQDGPRGAFQSWRQLGWRDLTMEQRVLQDRPEAVAWGLWGSCPAPEGDTDCPPVGRGWTGSASAAWA